MRIQGVTGDLPAVAHLGSGVPPVEPPAEPTAPPAVTAAASVGEAGLQDRRDRQPPPLLHEFDPPLIAQRALLGLPVGGMILTMAEARDISYNQASVAVDRAMALAEHFEADA